MHNNKSSIIPQDQVSSVFLFRDFSVEDALSLFSADYNSAFELLAEGDWQILDTFDQELKSAGLVLCRKSRQLILLHPDKGTVSQNGCPENWSFLSEVADGPVKDSLCFVDPLRSCLPVTELALLQKSYRVLDDQLKTVVRFNWLCLKPANEQSVDIVQLQYVRGYKKAFRKLKSVFTRKAVSTSGNQHLDLWSVFYPDQMTSGKKRVFTINPHESAFQVKIDLIGYYLAAARVNEAGVIADWDTEFLHDYRVSLRKVRSVLSLFKDVFSDEATGLLKVGFAEVMRATNRLRDLDVYLLDKPDYLSLVPSAMRPGLEKMFAEFSRERKKQLNLLKKQLGSENYLRSMDRLQQQFPPYDGARVMPSISTPAGPLAKSSVGGYASKLIYKRYMKIRKLARSVDDDTPDEEVHKLRIEFKKLRYLMEFFASVYPPAELKELLKTMKSLQSSLGRFNDYSVQQDSLNTVVELQKNGRRKTNMDIVRSIGALIAAIHNRQVEARHQIVVNIDGFTNKKTRTTFQKLFHSPMETVRMAENDSHDTELIGVSPNAAKNAIP